MSRPAINAAMALTQPSRPFNRETRISHDSARVYAFARWGAESSSYGHQRQDEKLWFRLPSVGASTLCAQSQLHHDGSLHLLEVWSRQATRCIRQADFAHGRQLIGKRLVLLAVK